MVSRGFDIDPTPLCAFDDIIDGYFPLAVSLGHMLQRLKTQSAFVMIAQAPIMHIPDLPAEAPVPLNTRGAYLGLIDHLSLRVDAALGGIQLSGAGTWRWLNRPDAPHVLDPMTRLAEPAFLTGVTPSNGLRDTAAFCVALTGSAPADPAAIASALGVPSVRLSQPIPRSGIRPGGPPTQEAGQDVLAYINESMP